MDSNEMNDAPTSLSQPWKSWFVLADGACTSGSQQQWPIMLAGNGHGNGQGSLPQAPRAVDFTVAKPRPRAAVFDEHPPVFKTQP